MLDVGWNMQEAVATIGRCVGCNRMRRLSGDGCEECLTSPNRGPRWLELARRVRKDPKFAAMCYAKIRSDKEKADFVKMYEYQPPTPEPEMAEIIPIRR